MQGSATRCSAQEDLNPCFRSCFLYGSRSQFAAAVARVHYATDPYYGSKLTEIIRLHDLEQYDVQGRH